MSTAQTPAGCNIAAALPEMARLQPQNLAVVFPAGVDATGNRTYSRLTYRELDEQSDAIARGLRAYGLSSGMRTVLMVKPSLEFFALTFALFKAGIGLAMQPCLWQIGLPLTQKSIIEHEVLGTPNDHRRRGLESMQIVRDGPDTLESGVLGTQRDILNETQSGYAIGP